MRGMNEGVRERKKKRRGRGTENEKKDAWVDELIGVSQTG